MEDWQPGVFVTRIAGKQEPEDRSAVGWIRHPFALDFRPVVQDDEDFADPVECQSAWVMTHIPTGLGVAAIMSPLEKAKAVADDFLAMGDWTFDQPEGRTHLTESMKAYRLTNAAILTDCSITIPPWHRLAPAAEAQPEPVA